MLHAHFLLLLIFFHYCIIYPIHSLSTFHPTQPGHTMPCGLLLMLESCCAAHLQMMLHHSLFYKIIHMIYAGKNAFTFCINSIHWYANFLPWLLMFVLAHTITPISYCYCYYNGFSLQHVFKKCTAWKISSCSIYYLVTLFSIHCTFAFLLQKLSLLLVLFLNYSFSSLKHGERGWNEGFRGEFSTAKSKRKSLSGVSASCWDNLLLSNLGYFYGIKLFQGDNTHVFCTWLVPLYLSVRLGRGLGLWCNFFIVRSQDSRT